MRAPVCLPPSSVGSPLVAPLFRVLFMLGFGTLLMATLAAGPALAQSLVSDRLDYPPGTIAILTGSGFEPNELVRMDVHRIDDTPGVVERDWSWQVYADETGNFVTEWYVCDLCGGASLHATAQGLMSGAFADCYFTDATAWSMSIAPSSSPAGHTQLYTLTALNTSTGSGNQMGCITVAIPAAFIPVGSPIIVPGSTTHSWTVNRVGQLITATANSNGDRIEPDEGIQIRISATAPASTAGSPFAWVSSARSNTNCTGNSFGIPEGGSPTVAVVCAAPAISCPANIVVNNDPGLCSAVVSFAATASGSPAPAVTYSQDPGTAFPVGTTTVTATATSSCGSTSCSFTVTVLDNTAPALALAGANPQTLECHGPAFSDPGASATDNCPGVGSVSASGVVDVNTVGTYVVIYSVTDAHGNPATATRTVHVVDTTNPSVALNGPADVTIECHGEFVDAGASASDACAGALSVHVSSALDANAVGDYVLTYSATDPSGNAHAVQRTVHVVDSTNPVVTLNGPADVTLECHGPAFSDPGASAADACAGNLPVEVSGSVDVNTIGDYVLTYSATDPSGNSHAVQRTVHVIDTTPPSISAAGADATISCPDAPVFTAPTASDACDGAPEVVLVDDVTLPGACAGLYQRTRSWKAVDAAGNSSDVVSQTITVVDTTPPALGAAGLDQTLLCPAVPVFTAPTASDGCDGNPVVFEVSDVTTPGACGGAYMRTRTWQARDCAGNLSDLVSQTITVTDPVAPVAAITGPPSGSIVSVGSTVTLQGVVSDNCGLAGASWQLDSIALPAGPVGPGGVVSTPYAFSQPGVYQIRLVATDACGNTATASLTPEGFEWTIIVYDPAAGFVTGGGWIQSPAGAYRPDPALVGKANFGFVSRYQKGARVPTGETEFQFKAGNLNFHSASYEWLVVAGARAQYKGVGTINGAGGYGFLLTAIDGQQQGSGGGSDRFRVKIWDRATSVVVYDNQYGEAEDSDATTALGGGSVVVHTAKGTSIPMATAGGGSIQPAATAGPAEFAFRGARPNPFVGSTEMAFELPERSVVTIHVYDVRGRKVATVTDHELDPGSHGAAWDGRGAGGERLHSGVYFARFTARSLVSERRLESVRKLHLGR